MTTGSQPHGARWPRSNCVQMIETMLHGKSSCLWLCFFYIQWSVNHVLITERWRILRATHCMLARYTLRQFCLSICLSHYQYHIHYWAIWNPLIYTSSVPRCFLFFPVWQFVCLCVFVCLLLFCCSLTYRFSHYYSACAICGQHDGHLPSGCPPL